MFVYREMIRTGKAPSVRAIGSGLKVSVSKIRESLGRLSASHAFMMQEDGELWRVAPFSAIPTAFPVRAGKRSWFGNCIWDALGIPAALGQDAIIDAPCGDCGEPMHLEVRGSKLVRSEGVVHFAVPAHHWWDNIGFT